MERSIDEGRKGKRARDRGLDTGDILRIAFVRQDEREKGKRRKMKMKAKVERRRRRGEEEKKRRNKRGDGLGPDESGRGGAVTIGKEFGPRN